MNMGGEAEHPRAGCPRNRARMAVPDAAAEPAGRMTRYSAAGGLLERVWPWMEPARGAPGAV